MSRCRLPALALLLPACLVGLASASFAQVKSHAKISATQGNFDALSVNERFGIGLASLGDFDGDGVVDIAAGAYLGGYTFGAPDTYIGEAYVILLNANGTVKSYVKIGDGLGGFTGDLDLYDEFGTSVTNIGDLDNDAVTDIAVGARLDNDAPAGPNLGFQNGALWILFLNADGTVKTQQKISASAGGFTGVIDNGDWFGTFATALGDLDADGVEDLVVAAPFDDDGAVDQGAFWVLYLNANGTVKSHQKVSGTTGGFTGDLDAGDRFGTAPGNIGDLDGDGVVDLAVGAISDDDGGTDFGAVWICYMNANGTVKSQTKISATTGGFTGTLTFQCGFGSTHCLVTSGGGISRIAVGAKTDDGGGENRGAVYLLDINSAGAVTATTKISSTEGGFAGPLQDGDEFGLGLAPIGDFDGDGNVDLAIGARLDDDGPGDAGAVWLLLMGTCDLVATPSDYDFGTITAGTSAEADFVLENTGFGVMSGSVTESCSGFSIISGGGPFSLGPDDSLVVTVRFAPLSAVTYSCVVQTGSECGQFSVTGAGINPPGEPDILSIVDVPNDQGRRVRITFARSGHDRPSAPFTIRGYEIYRRIDTPYMTTQPRSSVIDPFAGAPPRDRQPTLEGWDYVTLVPNHGEEIYHAVVGTLIDSTAIDGTQWSVFFVRATTSSAFTFFDSPPDSGYSTDDILPVPPGVFSVAYGGPTGNVLTWSASESEDLLGYKVYRSSSHMDPDPSEFVMFTGKTTWTDPVSGNVGYAIASVDSAGNESPKVRPGQSSNVGDAPRQLALYQNAPNPFNPPP